MDMYVMGIPSVEDWGFVLKESDFPESVTIYCGFLMTGMTLAFEDRTVDALVNIILAIAGNA